MSHQSLLLVLVACTSAQIVFASHASRPKHVILVIGDDLGWHDVGFHGSEIPTPNIDALASTGTILNNYYVGPTCSPTRASLMTGRYAIRTGISTALTMMQAHGLGLEEKLLPQYLKDAGYATHLVGKWHLGFAHKEYTPTYRGFDSHYGCLTGFTDFWDHTIVDGLDFVENLVPVRNETHVYRTDLYTDRVVKIIKQHKEKEGEKPLFLEVAHQAPHFGEEISPLQAPKKYVDAVSHIEPLTRKIYAAMVVSLDHSIGEMVLALNETGMLKDSLIVFTTDNGGASAGQFLSHASNWPLRGAKGSMWEGGVRGNGFVWHPSLHNPGNVSDIMMDVTDWLPTILAAVNVTTSNTSVIDGVNQWGALTGESQRNRNSISHGIINSHGKTLWGYRKGDYKIVFGKTLLSSWDGWYAPDYINTKGIYNLLEHYSGYRIASTTKRELIMDGFLKARGSGQERNSSNLNSIRGTTTKVNGVLRDLVGQFGDVVVNVSCKSSNRVEIPTPCNYGVKACLFNLKKDPCEYDNIADANPAIYDDLLRDLEMLKKEAVKPEPSPFDPRSFPDANGGVWRPWLDYVVTPNKTKSDPPTATQCVTNAAYRLAPTRYTLAIVLVILSHVLS